MMIGQTGRLALAGAVLAMMAAVSPLSSLCGEPDVPASYVGSMAGWERESGHHGQTWGHDDDGALIAFRWEEGEGAFGGSIYTIRDDGTDLRLLGPSVGTFRKLKGEGIAFDTSPAVSPDGTRIAYATLRHSKIPGNFDIVTAALDGGKRRQLTRDEESQAEPAWSPDGKRIAFLSGGRLHTMAADGSDMRSIVPEIAAVREPPAWSPDGTRLAFRGERDDVLYVVGADGSNLTQVTEEVAGRPAWSPDGRRLAFMREVRTARTALYVVEVEERRETLGERGFGPPVWSPDGTEVFFGHSEVRPDDEPLSIPGLFAVSVQGAPRIRRVTDLGTTDILGLAWSPDGGRLAVLMTPFSYYKDLVLNPYADVVLYTVAPDGSDLRVLARQGPDGELVAEGEAAR